MGVAAWIGETTTACWDRETALALMRQAWQAAVAMPAEQQPAPSVTQAAGLAVWRAYQQADWLPFVAAIEAYRSATGCATEGM